jgi:glycosyltransferase A (GT-A) superfamily protein (DUF2064 family)
VTTKRLVVILAEKIFPDRVQLPAHEVAIEQLSRLLFERAVRVASGIDDAHVRLVVHGVFAEAYQLGARWLRQERLDVRAHHGATADARRSAALRDAFLDGYTDVVVIAANVPALTTFELESAFAALTRDPRAAVIGPLDDGGVYLLGLRAMCEPAAANKFFHARAALQARAFDVSVLRALGDLEALADVEVEHMRLLGHVHPDAVELRLALDRVAATALADETAPPTLERGTARPQSMLN